MSWGAISPGRCPLCTAAGARHTLHIDGAPPKNEYKVEEFWDEGGRYHMHDKQERVAHMRCSNEHFWNVKHLSRCPCRGCDWNNQPMVNGGTGWPEPLKVEGT